jgi:ketosteroid isomerase-like protein
MVPFRAAVGAKKCALSRDRPRKPTPSPAVSHTDIVVLHGGSDNRFAYWTGWQHASVRVEGREEPVPMRLRVTEIFRRDEGEWKLIHRHADTAHFE